MTTEQRKCLVFGCQNYTDQGLFIGPLCTPCYRMLTTGKIGAGATFIHKMFALLKDIQHTARDR